MNAETIISEFARRGIEMVADGTVASPAATYAHGRGLVVTTGEDFDGQWWEVARRDSIGTYARTTHRDADSAAMTLGRKLGLR